MTNTVFHTLYGLNRPPAEAPLEFGRCLAALSAALFVGVATAQTRPGPRVADCQLQPTRQHAGNGYGGLLQPRERVLATLVKVAMPEHGYVRGNRTTSRSSDGGEDIR